MLGTGGTRHTGRKKKTNIAVIKFEAAQMYPTNDKRQVSITESAMTKNISVASRRTFCANVERLWIDKVRRGERNEEVCNETDAIA